jgi:hypothetical protein
MTRQTKGDEVNATIAAIADPLERLKASADLVRKSEEYAERARAMRDMAAIVAHLDDDVPPVVLYRDVLECSRGLFVRIIQRAPAKRPKIDDALDVTRESAAAVRRHEEIATAARQVRDETAMLLMSGGTDPISGEEVKAITNADVARATGLTTARIAQMRTGS